MRAAARGGIGGAVLAGGRSRRFGSEKAIAVVDGAPMIAHVLAVLRRGCEAVTVNAPALSGAAAHAAAHGLPLSPDAEEAPDGPLAGVLASLAWAKGRGFERLATAPCDTPRLPAELVARLRECGGTAYAATSDGPQPLCAIWRVADLPILAAALTAGRHPPVRQVLATLGARSVMFAETARFANLNAPEAATP